MSKFSSRLWVALAAAGLIAPILPSTASAVPTFARQTGYPCEVCHFQFIPKLSSQGRKFKLGGFTEISPDRKLIEADGLSLPEMPGLSAVVRFRHLAEASNGVTTNEAGFYDEAALWLGGRVGANIGAAWEWPGPAVSGKFVFLFANGDDAKGGMVLFTTDALGPFWGMETSNTGLVPNHRAFEGRDAVLTTRKDLYIGAGAASGMTFFYGGDSFNAALGLFAPVSSPGGAVDLAGVGARDLSVTSTFCTVPTTGVSTLSPTGVCLAGETISTVTTSVVGADAGLIPGNMSFRGQFVAMEGLTVGLYYLGGATQMGPGQKPKGAKITTNATGFDVDYQSGPMEVTFNFLSNVGTKTADTADQVDVSTKGGGGTAYNGMNLNVIYTVMPHLNAKLGYSSLKASTAGAKAATATGLGVNYGIAQNSDFALEIINTDDGSGTAAGKVAKTYFSILTAW